MAVLYGSQHVDEKYASTIEPNLYADTVLIPGVTYTDKYEEGPAGGIYVHKIKKGNKVVVGTPGRDFTDEAAADDLIPIIFNNNYQKSRKIYRVQANAVSFKMGEEYLTDSLNQTKEARQYSGIACMVNEGTVSADKTPITKANLVDKLTALRKEIKDAKGKANFALVSTDIYAMALSILGLQSVQDPAILSGELIKRFGLNIIECNSFDEETAKYYDKTGTLKTVDLTDVEMIVGYHEAFSLLDNMETYRLIDSENFNGSKAQVEYNSGMTVNSPEQIIVKKKNSVSYTVSYDVNGGTGSIDSVTYTGTPIELPDGTGLTGPEGKTVFKGWAKTANSQTATVTSPFTPTANTTLYAVWAAE